MDNITVTGDVGADFNMRSQFTVTDVDHLTDFTKVCCYISLVDNFNIVLGIGNRGIL